MFAPPKLFPQNLRHHSSTATILNKAGSIHALYSDTRISILLTIGFFYLVVSFLLRLALFFVFGAPAGASMIVLLPALSLGVINDLVTLCALLAPLSLYLFIVPRKFHQSLFGKGLLAGIIWIEFFAILYLSIAQYFFFKEFNSRFNLVAVDYLIYPHEVFGNIMASYHVGSFLLIVVVYASIALSLYWNLLKKTSIPQESLAKRGGWLTVHAVLTVLCLSIFSTHSFDFSQNRIINEITADGISSFFEALHTNHLDYNAFYRTGDAQILSNLLKKELATDASRSQVSGSELNRVSVGASQGLGKLNVVVIVEESFGCEQVDACGQGLDIDAAVAASSKQLTPELDELAKQGVFFNKAYATGTRTVRGLEAITDRKSVV